MKTLIVTDPRYTRHLTGPGHPERPERVAAIIRRLKSDGLLQRENSLAPRLATIQEISLCHDHDYIQLVERECAHAAEDGSTMISTGDAPICPDSFEIAKLSVGGVLTAVDAVFDGKAKNVFCAVRPPGHHASRTKGEGFCLFNNIAIGARYAQKKYGIERVLIVDWDVHHGNGTQWIFESDPSVYYLSTHQTPSYPGTGLPNEKGVGNISNFPITFGQDARRLILQVFQDFLPKEMEKFKPDFVMISAGFDSRIGDPLGMFNLRDEDFEKLTQEVKKISDKFAGGRLVSVLEGGYDLEGLASGVSAHVKTLEEN